jgi:hypothetical protein
MSNSSSSDNLIEELFGSGVLAHSKDDKMILLTASHMEAVNKKLTEHLVSLVKKVNDLSQEVDRRNIEADRMKKSMNITYIHTFFITHLLRCLQYMLSYAL